jgi:hypothetical protein
MFSMHFHYFHMLPCASNVQPCDLPVTLYAQVSTADGSDIKASRRDKYKQVGETSPTPLDCLWLRGLHHRFRIYVFGFTVYGLRFTVQSVGLKVQGFWLKIWDLGFKIWV